MAEGSGVSGLPRSYPLLYIWSWTRVSDNRGFPLDIVIIDTHSDINIYKTAGIGIAAQKHQGGAPTPAATDCGSPPSIKPAGCCQPLSTTATPATDCGTSPTKPIGCCQPLTTTATPATVDKGAGEGEQKENPEDIDFNEWVGAYLPDPLHHPLTNPPT